MINKRFLAGALLLMGYCSPLHAAGPSDSAYTLKGKIEGMSKGWVYLYHKQTDKIDSVQIKDGHFIFKGFAAQPEYCFFGTPGPDNQRDLPLEFFLQHGELTLTAKKDSLRKAIITGDPAQDEFVRFQTGQKALDAQEAQLEKLSNSAGMKGDKQQMDSVDKAFEALEAKRQQYVKDYAAAHPVSYISAFGVYVTFIFNPDAAVLENLYKGLDPAIQASYFGKKIKETCDIAELTAIGKPAPTFVQNDVDGKPVSLDAFKGQYVLVDFWASWCGPCRAENPNVVKAYKEYHPKGFAILGVSLDNNKDKWLAAIKQDQLDWTHVSDLKGWHNSVTDLYGVRAIPMNFLLDKEGRIIAKGLRGEDLEKRLAELVK
ncbi:MAG: AhpC/TSA family protein [Chitinophagaceae bacterium]|nr:AhpC/TSA family protein [Chitinophagaceae bacterium]